MDWNFAIETKLEALKRILATLVAMVGMTGAFRRNTLPRPLHRFVLSLLRPAEAATRRLIIVAARGLVVQLPSQRPARPKPITGAWTIPTGGRAALLPPAAGIAPQAVRKAQSPLLSLFDPPKRSGTRRRHAAPAVTGQITGFGAWRLPFFSWFKLDAAQVSPKTSGDLLDAGRLNRRLEAIGRALSDLPGQAHRLARWQARRNAMLALERHEALDSDQPLVELPSTLQGQAGVSPPLSPPHKGEGDAVTSAEAKSCTDISRSPHKSPRRLPPPCGEGTGVGVHSFAPARLRVQRDRQAGEEALSPFCPAKLPDLHVVAIWARERLDTS